MPLTMEQKAELFDYIASRAKEMKLVMPNGSADWLYNDRFKRGTLVAQLRQFQERETAADDDEEE